jgi:hypothetical protein
MVRISQAALNFQCVDHLTLVTAAVALLTKLSVVASPRMRELAAGPISSVKENCCRSLLNHGQYTATSEGFSRSRSSSGPDTDLIHLF